MTICENISPLLSGIIDIVLDAGHIMLEAGDERPAVHTKEGHANFVTAYDAKVQRFLIEHLSAFFPEAQFLGEEEGKNVFKDSYRKGFLFVIDPIDGTNNFIVGYNPSVISVGLMKDQKPYIGVVYNPWTQQVFYAERGCGSFCNDKPIHVHEKPLELSLVGFGTTPYNAELWSGTFKMVQDYLPRCIDVRRTGAAAWDLCQLACGNLGVFFERILGIYDFTAASVIAEEAGAVLCQMTGDPMAYDGPSSVMGYARGIKKEELLFECDLTNGRLK